MKNVKISVNLADGSLYPVDGESGRELIHTLLGDDWGPPPSVMVIEAETDDGKTVTIRVPYDERTKAHVSVR